MNNHVHLLINIYESPLSLVMKNINYRYARWMNDKDNRIGHVFQGRFRSISVNDEIYLVNLCRYIHLNPLEAKITDNVNNYPWSSHQYYTNVNNNAPLWLDINFMLLAVKNKTGFGYQDFMQNSVDREKCKSGLYFSETGDIIIDDIVMKQFNKPISFPREEKKFLPQDIVASIVCKHLNVEFYELCGSSHNHEISKNRTLLATYWLQYSDIKMSMISKIYQRTHATLSRQLIQLTKNINTHFPSELLFKITEELNAACACAGKKAKRLA